MSLEAALAEVLVHGEFGPALDVLAEITNAQEAAFFRQPRYFVGALGEAELAGKTGPDCVRRMLDDKAGVVLRGPLDEKVLDASMPALEAAHRRVRRFETLMGQNSGFMALIEKRIGACAALASAKGDIIWMSQSARLLLGDDAEMQLQTRLRAAMKEAMENPESLGKEFLLKRDGQAHVFGSMSFVREVPGASVHYIAVELHGTGVDAAADEAKLTKSEREVYRLLITGLANEDIAKQRFVSVETVRTHVKAIFRKLDVSSRLELVTRHSKK